MRAYIVLIALLVLQNSCPRHSPPPVIDRSVLISEDGTIKVECAKDEIAVLTRTGDMLIPGCVPP